MIQLLVATVLSAGLVTTLRVSQLNGGRLMFVTFWNYAVASLLGLGVALVGGASGPNLLTVGVAVPGGITYCLALVATLLVMEHVGLAIPGAVMRLSVVIPVFVSLVLWREYPTTLQGLGILLAIVALWMISTGGTLRFEMKDANGVWWVLAVFVTQGLVGVINQTFARLGNASDIVVFLAILFGSAAALAAVWARPLLPIRREDFLYGSLIGIMNLLININMIGALSHLPGIIVFPVYSAGGLVLVTVVAMVAWKERFSRLATAGLGIALVATVLVNLS